MLNHHSGARSTEHAAEHGFEFAFGFVERRHDEHALAGSQAVGFEHVRSLQALEEAIALVDVVGSYAQIGGCGYAMALHEALGKILAAFELCAGFARSHNHHISHLGVGFEIVVNASHQRVFVAHHHHVDAVVDNELFNGIEVKRRYSHIFAVGTGATIARGDIEFA